MENKSFNIDEILESVDSIISNKTYNKKNIIDKEKTDKQFTNQKIDMTFNRDTEKIIAEAEKAQDRKIIENKYSEPLILKNPKDEHMSGMEKNNSNLNFKKPLILLNEFNDGEEDDIKKE
jgi:hypothetical protein